MAEAFQASVGLAGNLPVYIVEALHDILWRLSPFGDVQILVGHELRDRKAVMDLHHADLLPRVVHPGLFVRKGAGLGGRYKMIEVPVVVLELLAAADGNLQALTVT